MTEDKAMAATPHTELIAELMDPNNPKNEREHAAVREIERLQKALAQPEQEPVAWEQFYPDIGKPQIEFAPVKIVAYNCTCGRTMNFESEHGVVAPQRTWVGLSEDDKVLINHDANFNQFMTAGEYADRVQQLTEARLKDKNT